MQKQWTTIKYSVITKILGYALLMLFACSLLNSCAPRPIRPIVLETPEWWEQRKETEAIVYRSTCFVDEGDMYYAYTANDGKTYDDLKTDIPCKAPPKSKFMVAYNPDSPRDHLFLWHKPVFENHQTLRYDFDTIPQRAWLKSRRKKDIVTFEKNEKMVKTIGLIGAARKMYLGSDSIISVSCSFKASWKYLEFFSYRELNEAGYHPDSLKGKIFWVEYIPNSPWRMRVLFDQAISETRKYTLTFLDIDDKTEKNLNEAAREVGNGGVVYWSTKKERTSKAGMKDFLKTYQPRDRKGQPLEVEIKIVNYENLEQLFE